MAWKLSQSSALTELFCAPGNPGTASLGQNIPLSVDDLPGLLSFARTEQIDLTVVGPEAPLTAGVVDLFQSEGLKVAGPDARAAQLEGSKVFTKRFLQEEGIPTAQFQVYSEPDQAERALRAGVFDFPTVVKADGLAAGKGVLICEGLDEALAAVQTVMRERKFGGAGAQIVIEEFLTGEEASFMVLTDGTNILPLVPSQDHKAIYEGDRGPNTGGMGAYSVDFLLTEEQRRFVLQQIIEPTVKGMAERGIAFRGVLYAGLMLTDEGAKVLEYNVRFGDPEAQVVLPRLKSDLVEVLLAVAEDGLSGHQVEWLSDAAVCVVVSSKGYPGTYSKGHEITGISMAEEDSDTIVFHAGTSKKHGQLLTSGGRVLGVTSLGSTLETAIMRVYEAVNKVHFDGMYYRRDIAAKGLRKTGIL